MIRTLKALFNQTFRKDEIDVIIKRLHFEDGTTEIEAEHPAFAILARQIADWFDKSGCVNYGSVRVFDQSSMRIFTVTVQRDGGATPAEVNTKLREALQAIRLCKHNPTIEKIIVSTFKQLGYDKDLE
jgi:hypothetical protein